MHHQINLQNTSTTCIHPHILDILFKHKREISRKLSDLKGLHFIDHVALSLINPDREMVIFSTTPSVEFNLLAQGLWQFDRSFNPHCYIDKEILFWEKAYSQGYQHEIKRIKETQHHFSLGFNLMRQINKFHFIYSFATRYTESDLHHYYQGLIPALLALGDYGYKQLQPVYQQYSYHFPPMIEAFRVKKHLKLIVNNS